MADPRTENETKLANFLTGVGKAVIIGIILYQCWKGFTL